MQATPEAASGDHFMYDRYGRIVFSRPEVMGIIHAKLSSHKIAVVGMAVYFARVEFLSQQSFPSLDDKSSLHCLITRGKLTIRSARNNTHNPKPFAA
jgi:hypothetical protein